MSYANYFQTNEPTFIDHLVSNRIDVIDLFAVNFNLLKTASETINLFTTVPLGNVCGNLVSKSDNIGYNHTNLVTVYGRTDLSLSLANANQTILLLFDLSTATYPPSSNFSSVYDCTGSGSISSDSGVADFVIPCQVESVVGTKRIQITISTTTITLPAGVLRLTCNFRYLQ